jgi:hypothetical protein
MSTSNAPGHTSTWRLVHSKDVAHADLTYVGRIATCVRTFSSPQNNRQRTRRQQRKSSDSRLRTFDYVRRPKWGSNVRWCKRMANTQYNDFWQQ